MSPTKPSSRARKTKTMWETMKTAHVGFVIAVIAAAASLGCTPAQVAIIDSQVPGDVVADIECVTSELLQGALTDPAAIISQCGPLLAQQIINLADNLLQAPAGAAVAVRTRSRGVAHLALIVLTDAQRTRITTIRAAAAALVAQGTP